MKNSVRNIQFLIVTVIMALGLVMGTTLSANADKNVGYNDGDSKCGTCDYDEDTQLEFCNFISSGGCAGNDGGPCGEVACGE